MTNDNDFGSRSMYKYKGKSQIIRNLVTSKLLLAVLSYQRSSYVDPTFLITAMQLCTCYVRSVVTAVPKTMAAPLHDLH